MLHAKDLNLFDNLIHGIQFALSSTWANFARIRPSFFIFGVGLPEWPRPALSRSLFIDRAFARLRVKEDAIAILELNEAPPNADFPRIFPLELFDGHL